MDPITQRYSRAVRLTAPKLAIETPGNAIDGYWLRDNLFFFLAERYEPSIERVVTTPSVADTVTNRVEPALSLDVLADLLADYSARPMDLKALSTADFAMPDRDSLGVSVAGRDYLIDLPARRVKEARGTLRVPALYSPDGRYACFVKDHDLWLHERHSGQERRLTSDGTRHHCYGQQPESAPSSVPKDPRRSPVGVWSQDSRWFLTHRIDEPAIPESALIQHAPPDGGRPTDCRFIYPMPGDPLPMATYVAIQIASGRRVTFDDWVVPVMVVSPISLHGAWFGGPDTAWLVRFDRYFKRADLIRLDLTDGSGRIVLGESVDSGYLDLNHNVLETPNVRTLAGSEEIIWFSERDGWGHLYLYDAATGSLKNRITQGEWLVRCIVHINEKDRKLLFLAGGVDPSVDPARRTLCSVNLDGTGFEVLLHHEGDIFVPMTDPCGLEQGRPFQPAYAQAGISPDGHFGVVRYASVDRGNRTEIVDFRTRRGFNIAAAIPELNGVPPRHFTLRAADGVTPLYGVMFFPSNFDEERRYPLVDYIYAGPHTQHQPQSFRSVNSAPAMSLAELGCVTIMLDTRGIPTRSRAFHQVGYGELLEPHLADHAAAARQLCERYRFIDPERVGMIGYSAGGAATARALFDYGEVFKVGISVCGNHDSSFLSVFMSDKYRGPGGRDRWAHQANNAAAHKLEGSLLLMSSDVDTCVHIGHTLSLVDALIRANKDFDLLIVPNEGHDMLLTSGYVQRRVWDYVAHHLLKEVPPRGFEMTFEPHEVAHYQRSYAREQRQ